MILAARFSALGDIAMTVPALYDVCLSNPSEQFLMLTRRGPANLFVNPPSNLTVRGIDLDQYRGAAGLWKLARELKEEGVTRFADLHDVLRTQALRTFFTAMGINCARIHKGRRAKRNLTRQNAKHVVRLKNSIDRYRDTFRRLGLEMKESFVSLFPEGADPALFAAASTPKKPDEKWIGIAPFARHKGKVYPPELMEEAIGEITAQPGVKVFIFAGGAEEEKQASLWAARFPGTLNLAPLKMGFKAEMALMNHCDVVLSMDSANMHLASLAGTRVVSIWGATHPYAGFMGFRQKEADTLQSEMGCRPCSVFGNKPCRRGDYLCMRAIAPQRIVKALGLASVTLLLATASLPWQNVSAQLNIPSPAQGIFTPAMPSHPELPEPGDEAAPDPWNPEYQEVQLDRAWDTLMGGQAQQAWALLQDIRAGRLPLALQVSYWYGHASAAARLGLLEEVSTAAAKLEELPQGQDAATFLQAYLAYRQRNFGNARKLLKATPSQYLPDLYSAQIELAEGNWAGAIRLADRAIDRLKADRSCVNAGLLPGMLRTSGLASFKTGDDTKARERLEEYFAVPGTDSDAEARYALAQIEYEAGNRDRAQDLLAPIAAAGGVLAQGAAYTLGQIEASQANSRAAALDFAKSARLNFDPATGQRAIYNYIAAGTNGGNVPFVSGAEMYENYVANRLSTPHDAQLNRTFAREYSREGNFVKALQAIRRLDVSEPGVKADLQKILYQAGRREAGLRNYAQGARYFEEGAGIDADKTLAAECRLWLGDALYAAGEHQQADRNYLAAAKSLKGPNRTLALYNHASALFAMHKFKEAEKAFAEALAAKPPLKTVMRNDALVRLADARFYSGNYAGAEKAYAQAASAASANADYASLRRALALGLTGNINGKIELLKSFPNSFPNSVWTPEALLELGNTYSSLDRLDEATAAFNRAAAVNPSSPQARKAGLAMAQAFLKQGNRTEAAGAYKKVILSWPTSEEAAIANDDMMRLAAADGTLAEYAAFLQSVKGAPTIDSEKMEQLAFEAAEDVWADDISQCELLYRYLTDYPDGRYVAQALLDVAESEAEAGNGPAALSAYLRLETKGGAEYASEAYAGIMNHTEDPAQRALYASKVIQAANTDAETMEKARLFQALENLDNPLQSQESVSLLLQMARQPETESGARAAVELGEWLVKNSRNREAVDVLTAFTDTGSPHAYWLARGFIALSDAYRNDGQVALADEYLKSLKDNYPGSEPDILNAISSRLRK